MAMPIPNRVSRPKMMVANWKMHKTAAETAEFFARLREILPARRGNSPIVVAPPFTAIAAAVEAARGTDIAVAGQDLYWVSSGAFTGEVSGPMLAAAGCRYVLVGHSERRQYFGETDDTVHQKIVAALAAHLTPIVCVGESAEQRQAGQTELVLCQQFERAFAGISAEEVRRCMLAYEPVWAIGTGNTATPAMAQAAHCFLRRCVHDKFGPEAAAGFTILYGGSVTPDNVAALLAQPDVDGGLVGGASLEADCFAALVKGAALHAPATG